MKCLEQRASLQGTTPTQAIRDRLEGAAYLPVEYLPAEYLRPWDAVTKQRISPCNLLRLFSAQVSTFRLNFQMYVLTLFLQYIYSPASGSRYLSLWLCGLHEQSLVRTGKAIQCTPDNPSYAMGTIPSQTEEYCRVLKNWARWWMGSRKREIWDLAGVA